MHIGIIKPIHVYYNLSIFVISYRIANALNEELFPIIFLTSSV